MFGNSKKRYKEAKLNCPYCGAAQTEPAQAISSFCRSCGEHFRIEHGEAKAPPGAHVSGINPVFKEEKPDRDEEADFPDQPMDYPDFSQQVVRPPRRDSSGASEDSKHSWLEEAREKKVEAARSQSVRNKERRKDHPKPSKHGNLRPVMEELLENIDEEEGTGETEAETGEESGELGAAAQPAETLKEGSMEALFGKSLEKMQTKGTASDPVKLPPTYVPVEKKKKLHEPGKRSVRCFECNHQQLVSLSATSTQCGRCSVYISLQDHEISSVWSNSIRTRGSVVIHRRGSLVGCDVACEDLTVAGKISASVDCSGDAHFKNSGRVLGHMHCRHLQIDKKCKVAFPQGVIAESADVYGTIEGNVTCPGTVRIFKSGAVIGDAKARNVVLKDGGVLTGNMVIQPDLEIELAEKKGYLETHK